MSSISNLTREKKTSSTSKATDSNRLDNVVMFEGIQPNTPPTMTLITISTLWNTVYAFTAANFTSVFSDADGDGLRQISIVTTPGKGLLKLSGTPVLVGQIIALNDLVNLTYEPATNGNGLYYSEFELKVDDDGLAPNPYSIPSKVIFHIDGNLPPNISDNSITTTQDTNYTFTLSDFTSNYQDNENDNPESIQILTLPLLGILKYNSVAVNVNDIIPFANIANFEYEPPVSQFGVPYTDFTFQIQDDVSALWSAVHILTINVSQIAAPICVIPAIAISNITTNSFEIDVTNHEPSQTYDLSLDGGLNFPITNIGANHVESSLPSNTTYNVTVRTNCSTTNSSIVTVTTQNVASCIIPTITVTDIDGHNMTVNITNYDAAQTYDISIDGGVTWIVVGHATSSKIIGGLNHNTTYDVVVKADCSPTNSNAVTVLTHTYRLVGRWICRPIYATVRTCPVWHIINDTTGDIVTNYDAFNFYYEIPNSCLPPGGQLATFPGNTGYDYHTTGPWCTNDYTDPLSVLSNTRGYLMNGVFPYVLHNYTNNTGSSITATCRWKNGDIYTFTIAPTESRDMFILSGGVGLTDNGATPLNC